MRPDARDKKFGDISSRIALRRQLQCKSFDWYMTNVYPELGPPQIKANLSAKQARLDKLKRTAIDWKRPAVEILFRYQVSIALTPS